MKGDQEEKGSGWIQGPFPCCRSTQGQEAAGTHWGQCCGVAWLRREEQWGPGAVCPQRFIRADGVTGCLHLSCCPHIDVHRALCSIRNTSRKARIHQEWTVICLPGMSLAKRVLEVLFVLMSDTLNLCCRDWCTHTAGNH